MTALPDVYEALLASWRAVKDQLGLDESQILDGPAVTYVGSEGVAVGATADDTTAEFEHPPGTLDGESERATIPCLVWAGTGDTTFTTIRARVQSMLAVLRADLARDRSIRQTVDAAWITGGVFVQEQTRDANGNYRGALAMCEFRIEYSRF